MSLAEKDLLMMVLLFQQSVVGWGSQFHCHKRIQPLGKIPSVQCNLADS